MSRGIWGFCWYISRSIFNLFRTEDDAHVLIGIVGSLDQVDLAIGAGERGDILVLFGVVGILFLVKALLAIDGRIAALKDENRRLQEEIDATLSALRAGEVPDAAAGDGPAAAE